MGIRFYCPKGHKVHVKEFQAGQTGFCPTCGVRMQIPMESTRPSSREEKDRQREGEVEFAVSLSDVEIEAPPPLLGEPPAPASSAANTFSASPAGAETSGSGNDPFAQAGDAVWYVRPASGGQFGPATADDMRNWLAEGRIGADSLVWCESWSDWRQAVAVFPQLAPLVIPGLKEHFSEIAAARRARSSRARAEHVRNVAVIVLAAAVVVLSIVLIWVLSRL